jgi:serine/threonine protein kinase
MDNDIAHLSDFGLSNVINELQGPSFFTSKVGGSARWIAPELLQDATPAMSSDVYSFGSVAFYVSGQSFKISILVLIPTLCYRPLQGCTHTRTCDLSTQ